MAVFESRHGGDVAFEVLQRGLDGGAGPGRGRVEVPEGPDGAERVVEDAIGRVARMVLFDDYGIIQIERFVEDIRQEGYLQRKI